MLFMFWVALLSGIRQSLSISVNTSGGRGESRTPVGDKNNLTHCGRILNKMHDLEGLGISPDKLVKRERPKQIRKPLRGDRL